MSPCRGDFHPLLFLSLSFRLPPQPCRNRCCRHDGVTCSSSSCAPARLAVFGLFGPSSDAVSASGQDRLRWTVAALLVRSALPPSVSLPPSTPSFLPSFVHSFSFRVLLFCDLMRQRDERWHHPALHVRTAKVPMMHCGWIHVN